MNEICEDYFGRSKYDGHCFLTACMVVFLSFDLNPNKKRFRDNVRDIFWNKKRLVIQ